MSRQALSRDSWIEGALAMAGELGLHRVAVEPLAKRLGTTKGSFYWHFADRPELISALLQTWETQATQQVIAHIEQGAGERRLKELLMIVFADHEHQRTEWAILQAVDDAMVATVVDRVHQARLTYLVQLYGAAGLAKRQAAARARLAYAAYLGNLQLSAAAGRGMSAAQRRAFIDEVMPTLT